MNLNMLRGLMDAGFTNEQIKQIVGIVNPVKNENNEPKPKPMPEPEPRHDNNINDTVDNLKNVLDNSFNDFIKKFQSINIMNSSQPKQETADDILASIINPPERR